MTMRAVLSTGSNMEDSRAHLATVEAAFAAAGELVAASPLYATAPWGGVEQPDFYNQILIVDVDDSPEHLLRRCQDLERTANRVRDVRWGPRTLDVDIITLYDTAASSDTNSADSAFTYAAGQEITVDTPDLTVPHPRAHERAFVLVPWFGVDEGAVLGGRGVDTLIAVLDPDEVAGVREVAQ